MYLTRSPRGPSLEDLAPDLFNTLLGFGATCRLRLREEMQIEFTIEDGQLSVLDAVKVARSARARLRIAVTLAEEGDLDRRGRLARRTRALAELLHPQIDPRGPRDVFVRGMAASPRRRNRSYRVFGKPAGRVPHGANPAFWCAAKPRPRIFAACIRPPAS